MSDRKQVLLQMLEQTPQDAFLRYAYALEIAKSESVLQAIDLLEKLLKEQPTYLGAYYQLAKFYEATQANELAIATYKKGMELALKTNEQKTYRELKEALFIFSDED